MSGGKGFGGGEATRDPKPTEYDPNDPKGKQQAIHKAETFADYLARRKAEEAGVAAPSASAAVVPTVREGLAPMCGRGEGDGPCRAGFRTGMHPALQSVWPNTTEPPEAVQSSPDDTTEHT